MTSKELPRHPALRRKSSLSNSLISALSPSVYLQIRWHYFRFLNHHQFSEAQRRRTQGAADGYDVSTFDRMHAIFIHIPKCAGVSVSQALFNNLAGGHLTLDLYLDIFEPRKATNYFKFTFVRNPWDRLLSAFTFLKRGGFNPEDDAWAQRNLAAYDTFEDFVLNWVTPDNMWKWPHFHPQHHFFTDRHRKLLPDYFGFFENLQSDFEHIAAKLDISASLPLANASEHIDYRRYYTDRTSKIVADVYAEDIRLLGYSFDNASLPKQIFKRDNSVSFIDNL